MEQVWRIISLKHTMPVQGTDQDVEGKEGKALKRGKGLGSDSAVQGNSESFE